MPIEFKYGEKSFKFDVTARQLYKEDMTAVNLKKQQKNILLYMLKNPGRLITYDDLYDKFWEGRDLTLESVTQPVRDLRRALGGNQANPLFIVTDRGEGFRFVGEVLGVTEDNSLVDYDDLDIEPRGSHQSKPYHLGDPLLDAAWDAYLSSNDERRLYHLEEAAGVGHPKVRDELLRIPANQHCLEIAKLAPFPEYVPIAIRALTTTYDQSNFSAWDFLSEAARRIPNELEEKHLIPAVAIASALADTQGNDNETATSFGLLLWFVGNVGKANAAIRDSCRRILSSVGQLDLEDWYRKELDAAVARIDE